MDAQLELYSNLRNSLSVTRTVQLLSNKVQNQFHKHQCQRHFTLKDALPYIWRSGWTYKHLYWVNTDFNIASLPQIRSIDLLSVSRAQIFRQRHMQERCGHLDVEILSFCVIAYIYSLWQCVVRLFLYMHHTVVL